MITNNNVEKWRDIPGYEGAYEASTFGRIRTKEGKTTYTELRGVRHWKSRILKGRGDKPKTGKRVGLWLDGKCEEWLVARLIALTFIGSPPDKYTVNHIDGNRMNNRLENLEWLSLGDNIRHGFENNLYPQKKTVLIAGCGNKLEFRSLSEAGRGIGRSVGYVSQKVKDGKPAIGIDGTVYSIAV